MEELIAKHPYVEELANALTHGVGVAIFMVLCPLLIAFAVQTEKYRKIIGVCFFSFGLLAVYLSSTIFHAISDKMTKETLHYFDLLSIYFLIGGTYTAFILIYFRNLLGNILLTLIWIVSFFGILLAVFLPNANFIYSLILYLALGWIGIVLVKPSIQKVPPSILLLLVAGGLFYTLGTYFFYHDYISYYHAVWHLFVLGGSMTHWVAILLAVKDNESKLSHLSFKK